MNGGDTAGGLLRYRELLAMLTWREIAIRYKQTLMGFLWAILMPMVVVAAGILVRGAFTAISNKPLALSAVFTVAVKSVPWAFFVGAIRFATNSLIANTNLVTKVSLPRAIFPIASVCSQLLDFAVAGLVLGVVLVVGRAGVTWEALWVIPLVLILIALTMGISILTAAASLFYRDVKYLVEVFLTFAIFFTPVLYDVDMFTRLRDWLLLNPVAPILEGLADALVKHQTPPLPWVGYSAAFAGLLLVVALWTFRRLDPLFAERI